mmetsp:Transcript_43166/g.31533  ORF Transcript_43166/g.31533 Transcript_43166/m.31533 type:complete len:86 (+) Transcript_43166:32-289(+)
MLLNVRKQPFNQMLLYSGHGIGDLGSKASCQNQTMGYDAEHVIFNVNISTMPININLGFCLPAICEQETYTTAGIAISRTITNLL